MADREGKLTDNPRRIKIDVLPGDNYDVEAALNSLHKSGLIIRYELDGNRYIRILNPYEFFAKDRDSDRGSEMVNAPRQAVYKRDGFACVYCGAINHLSLDHVIPYSRGGDESIDNLVTCCRSCNSHKGARTPEEAGMRRR